MKYEAVIDEKRRMQWTNEYCCSYCRLSVTCQLMYNYKYSHIGVRTGPQFLPLGAGR